MLSIANHVNPTPDDSSVLSWRHSPQLLRISPKPRMPIGAVNGSRTLFESHLTKFCTWKLYDILVTTLSQAEHTGKCTLVKVFCSSGFEFSSLAFGHNLIKHLPTHQGTRHKITMLRFHEFGERPSLPIRCRQDICVHRRTSR